MGGLWFFGGGDSGCIGDGHLSVNGVCDGDDYNISDSFERNR